jgi:phage baseplate assembly protein V
VNTEILRYIRRLFEHHARKMRNIVARGEVSLVLDSPKMQTNQIRLLDGELIDEAERAQQYGFTSHPLNGAEAFAVFVGAAREHPVILAVDDRRFRVTGLRQGEVCIYTDEGDAITLKRGNRIEVKTHYADVLAEKNITARAGGDISAQAAGNIAANAGQNLTAQAGAKAALTAGTDIELIAAASVKLSAPSIILAGSVMLLPGPGGGASSIQSAGPITVNAPQISLNED